MKKKISCCLLLCMTLMLSVGCGNEIPEMDETTRKMVVEYTANVVREHDLNHSSRLMDVDTLQAALEEEAMLEAVFSEDYSTEPVAGEADGSDNDTVKEAAGTVDNTSKGEVAPTVPLAEALDLEDVEIDYVGHEVTNSYPQESDNIYFTMDATEGSKLVVLKFDVTNTAQNDKQFDILSKGVYFKVVVDGESRNALTTMLLNDMANYQGTIAAGAKEQLVVVCEIAEDKAAAIGNIALNMKTANETIAITLK